MTIIKFDLKVQGVDLKEVVSKLIPDSIGKDIEKACFPLYPLQDVYIKKVGIGIKNFEGTNDF